MPLLAMGERPRGLPEPLPKFLDGDGTGRLWMTGVEVFSTGTWKKLDFGLDDLEAMEAAFQPTIEQVHPVVVTNHSEDADEGQTRGFVGRLYRNESPFTDWEGHEVKPGERLFADLLLDEDLAADVKDWRYHRPSIEIRPDIHDARTGKVYPWVMTAVSFQGGRNLEAVRNLKPLPLSLEDGAVPLYFRHDAKALVMDQEDKTMPTDNAPGAEDPQAAMMAMMSEMLELLRGIASKKEEPMEEKGKPKEGVEAEAAPPAAADAKFAELERQLQEAVKMAEVAEARRIQDKRQSDAEKHIAAISNEKCLKVPVKLAQKAVWLKANAPSAVKFSDGKTYENVLDELLDGLPDVALMFREQALTIPNLDEDGLEAMSGASAQLQVQAKARQLVKAGNVKTFAEGVAQVLKTEPSLYAQHLADRS